MANCVTDWIFRRQRFCCCLPVRLGVGVLSFLTILLAGLLMVILWFEVATNYFMSGGEKTAFILAGVLETFLFLASVLGFVGTCARKQSFVVVYATFLYVHFCINLGVAIYFLWMVTHAANTDIVRFCQDGVHDPQAKDQCTGLLNVAKGVYWGVLLFILAIEAYCALVVTRYVNQLRYEKRDVRRARAMQRQSAYDAFHRRFSSASGATMVDGAHGGPAYAKLGVDEDTEKEGQTPFDPYEAYGAHDFARSADVYGCGAESAGVEMAAPPVEMREDAIKMGRLPSTRGGEVVPPPGRLVLDSPHAAQTRTPLTPPSS
ncbi:hypothetical protein DFH11DRAFT_1562213 [Phellopilus nigrolimitatus]|nr:hypothetical protein DFH11DRAFT_1562213 [Phellopilus nigrolimitatus]